MNSEDISWSKIPQYPACQILDVMDYFLDYKEEQILQLYILMNQVPDIGVSIYFEEKNKVSSRHLKTNMLSFEGHIYEFNDLLVPQYMNGILNFQQNIFSEKEKNKHCKNYPFEGFSSFGDCDKKYLNEKFVNFYKIMPFWATLNLSEVTSYRLIFYTLILNKNCPFLLFSYYVGEDFVDFFDGTLESPCFQPCVSTKVFFNSDRNSRSHNLRSFVHSFN